MTRTSKPDLFFVYLQNVGKMNNFNESIPEMKKKIILVKLVVTKLTNLKMTYTIFIWLNFMVLFHITSADFWQCQLMLYSLISMRPIFYFDTWAIIWYGIASWFMVFPPFSPVLVCCDHQIVLHRYENQNKNNLVIILGKSWDILGNLQKSTNNYKSNSG